jgi:hypothetical protein
VPALSVEIVAAARIMMRVPGHGAEPTTGIQANQTMTGMTAAEMGAAATDLSPPRRKRVFPIALNTHLN